jgi:proline dehydrogenase
VFRDNLRTVVAAAAATDVFVWCDMEDHTTTEPTLSTFEQVATNNPWTLGQCLQSNLRRTEADLERVVDVPGKLRLVKGAYDEPESVAYTTKAAVNDRFKADIEYLFATRDRGVAVGTHDPEMIDAAIGYHDSHGTDFEFQLLMGVREDRQRELASEGYEVWQYAPYGDQWLSYFWRRINERKENALFALRAVVAN